MKNVVIDTSVAMKWFFPENGFEKALDLKAQHMKGELTLYTRDLFLYEFVSAFKNYSMNTIEEKDISLAVAALMSLNIELVPLQSQEAEMLYALSRRLHISVYDGSFILLASHMKAPLVTADKKLYLKGKKEIKMVWV